MFARIIGSPSADYAGATVAADVAVDDTTITVDTIVDLDEDAAINDGTLITGIEFDSDGLLDLTGATLIPYTTVDDDTDTVQLAAGSPVAIDAGEFLYVLDPVTGEPVLDWTAYVEVEGADHDGDPLPAIVAQGLVNEILDSDDDEGLAVTVEVDEDDQLVITNVHGSRRKARDEIRAENDDSSNNPTMIVSAGGTQELLLRFRPILNSEHVRWHPGGGGNTGVYQKSPRWTRDGWTITFPDDEGLVRVGDEFSVEYLTRDTEQRPAIPASLELISSGYAVDPVSSIDLEDAVEGDLFVLTIVAHDIIPADCTDGRVEESHAQIINPGSPTISVFFGWGRCDSSGDPLPITCPGDARVEWAVFRTTGTVTSVYTPLSGTAAPHVPDGLTADMGITVLGGLSHFIPSPFSDDTTDQWTTVSPGLDSGGTVDASTLIAYSLDGTPDGSWDGLDSGPRWAALMLGLTGE